MQKTVRSSSLSRRASTWRASIRQMRASATALVGVSTLIFGAAIAPSAHAANDAWSTAPGDGNFAGNNWTVGTTTPGGPGGTILSGDSLYFGMSSIVALTENETAGFGIGGFTFNAGAAAFTIAGNSFALSGGMTNNSANVQTINDAFTMAATNTFTTTTGGGNLALGGVISGAGGMTVAGGGTGTLTLNVKDTYTGGTIVNGGTLVLNSGGGAGTVQGAVTVNTGGTLSLTVTDALGYSTGTSITQLNVNGGTVTNATTASNEGFLTNFNLTGGTVTTAGTGNFLFGSTTTSTVGGVANVGNVGITSNASGTTSVINAPVRIQNSNLAIAVASGTTGSGVDLSMSGVISQFNNGLAIVKTGTGNLALSGISTYTGGTTVSGGTLTLSAGGSAGAVRGVLTVGTGTTLNLTVLDALGYTAGTQVSQLNVNGGTVNNSATLGPDVSSGNQGYVTSFSLTGGTLASSTGGAYDFNGSGFTDTAGTIVPGISSNASATTSLISAPVIIRGGNLGFTVAKGAAAVDLSVTGTIIANPTAGAVTGLTKTGAGVLQLTGAFVNVAANGTVSNVAASGTTLVNGGTLLVNNAVVSTTSSPTGATTVTVGNGTNLTGTLGGTGSILGATTINAGSTITGATVGTAGTLTLQSTLTVSGTYLVDFSADGTMADRLTIAGALSLTNAVITFSGTPNQNSYILATDASETGAFTGTAPNGYAYQFNAAGTELDLVKTSVPEPATWLAGGLLVGLVGLARRRQIAGWLGRAAV